MSHITTQTHQPENRSTANRIYCSPGELHRHGLETGRWFPCPEAHGWLRKQEEPVDLLELSLNQPSSSGWTILVHADPMLTSVALL